MTAQRHLDVRTLNSAGAAAPGMRPKGAEDAVSGRS